MKRRLLPLAALLCAAVLCMTMAFAAESYTISIDVPAGTLHTGDSFTAGITLHGRAGENAPSTLQVDVIYAGCVCTDAAVTVPGALVTYAEGRLCISYLEQEAVFDEKGTLALGTATFTAGSTNAVLTVSDSAALAGGEEVSVTLPQAVTVAVSGATVTPEVKVAEDGTASIDGTVVAGTGAVYEPEEDTSEGAGTGDTDAAASTDAAAADKEAHDTPAGETHTALWVALAAVVIACAVLLIVKRKGATK